MTTISFPTSGAPTARPVQGNASSSWAPLARITTLAMLAMRTSAGASSASETSDNVCREYVMGFTGLIVGMTFSLGIWRVDEAQRRGRGTGMIVSDTVITSAVALVAGHVLAYSDFCG